MNSVTLPWPTRDLSPNARVHYQRKARAVKSCRRTAWALALEAKLRVDWQGDIHVFVTFHPPSNRRFDQDNIEASCKAAFDGLADALKVNDNRFRIHPAMGLPVKGGSVVITVEETR